jgi:glycosyltransferase involved in cell wall biosynthesis
MIAIDGRSLQDASRFRGIGTVVRDVFQYIPNKKRYLVFFEDSNVIPETFGLQYVTFKASKSKKKYYINLFKALQKHSVRWIHFMAQYNLPDNSSIPFSVTVHDLFNPYFLIDEKKYNQLLEPLLLKLKNAQHIIAISEYTKSEIEKYIPTKKGAVSVIHNGICLKQKAPPMDTQSDFLCKRGIHRPFILYVGNYEFRKNMYNAMRGFLQFYKENPEYSLVICSGRAPLFPPIKMQGLFFKYRHCIHRFGYIQSAQIQCLFRHATTLLFPSLAEGFGVPILEAMSVNTPVVVSNTTSLPEVGKNAAIYVDPNDTLNISQGLLKSVQPSVRVELRRNMLNVLPQFDVNKQAALYDQQLHDF